MIRVALASAHDLRFMLRQTPAGDGAWGDVRIEIGGVQPCEPPPSEPPPDWLLVVDAPPDGLRTRVPVARRILAVTEPPAIRHYSAGWLSRFGAVIAASAPPGFGGRVLAGHPCMPWFHGLALTQAGPSVRLGWAELAAGASGPRPGVLSAVCSTKRVTVEQVRRLRFLRMLGDRLGERLQVFGRGFGPLDDKAKGIDGFRYHLVLENNAVPGMWTEKLADPILSGAYPIVAGGGGLARWFDPLGFAEIDLRAPRVAAAAVARILADDPAARPAVRAAMAGNRRRLMEEHQLFPVIADHVRRQAKAAGPPPLAVPDVVPRPDVPVAARLRRAARPLIIGLAPLRLALFERG